MATPSEHELKNPGYECFILALSILSVVNLVLALVLPLPETTEIIWAVDIGISVVFLADFSYRLFSAPSKRGYFVRQLGWLDLVGSLPFPGLRLARLFRMVRVTRLLRQTGPGRLWRTILRDRAGSTLLSLLFLTIVLLEVASVLVLGIEIRAPNANIRNASDALWWTYVTVTTVGYGDRYPVTNLGRLVGVLTMAVGVGLFGTLTGFLANAFLRPATKDEDGGEDDLKAELAEIRRQLAALQSRIGAAAAPDPPDRS